MTIHPKAKRWVAVVEFIGFPIVVSILLNVSAGPTAYWQAGVFALVCIACFLPMLFYLLEHAAATVTVEAEQSVVATGPYALVRHPMYSALLAMFLGVPVALGSWWGLFAFLPLLVVIIWRLLDEERYLSNHLAGYRDYCAQVIHRLLPWLW